MDASQRNLLLQLGRVTSPETFIWDLESIGEVSVKTQRLGAAFLGGGLATFITISLSKTKLNEVIEAVNKHLKRLKKVEEDDVVILLSGTIKTTSEEIRFGDVKCKKQISLKGKSPEKVKELMVEALAEAA
jgi:uncharacterized protein YciI